MPSLYIPNLPEDVFAILQRQAALENRSLEEQAIVSLRAALLLTAKERRHAILDGISERIKREGYKKVDPPPEVLIREDRDR
jgi:plasmid stability protein